MDLFVFPSRTDTYGNVVQEAAASGVPAIVTTHGGPQCLVVPGVTGFAAENDREFVDRVLKLVADRASLRAMGAAARQNILAKSWDGALEMVYSAYRFCGDATFRARSAEATRVLARPQMPAA
jgi:phosphatidylinositol alpha 1,6-mannosyltransferase